MPVSVKKRPASTPNITSSLNMINDMDVKQDENQIQTVAPSSQNQKASFVQNLNEEEQKNLIKKSTKDTQIIFRTTEENKNYLKGFFATYGMTLSKGIQLACFYLEQQIKSGNVEINSAGLITKQERR